MSQLLRFLSVFAMLAALAPRPAAAQECVSCWSAKCPDYKDQAAVPPCKAEKPVNNGPKPPGKVTVWFSSVPDGAQVRVDGADVCTAPCNHAVTPGRHEVEMDLGPGYDVARRTFTFSSTNNTAELTPTPRFAQISVTTDPTGLQVALDGVRIGQSPIFGRDVTTGPHQVSIDDPCWEPSQAAVFAAAGGSVPVSLRGQARVIQVDASVTDATGASVPSQLSVDGRTIGTVPGSVLAPACAKSWVVSAADGRRWEGSPAIGGGKGTLRATLPAPPRQPDPVKPPVQTTPQAQKPMTAFLTMLSNPPGAPVSMDGIFQGNTPIYDAVVPPGAHVVSTDDPCAEHAAQGVSLAAGDRKSVTLEAPRKMAQIDVRPEDIDKDAVPSSVTVDGTYVGEAPGVLTVPLCAKRIEVKGTDDPGLRWSGALFAQANQTVRVVPRMVDPANPRAAKTKWRTTIAWRLGMSGQTGVLGTGLEVRWGPIGLAAGFGAYGTAALTFGGPSNDGGLYGEIHGAYGNPAKWYFDRATAAPETGFGATLGYDLRPVDWLSLRFGAGAGYSSVWGDAWKKHLLVTDASLGLVF